MMTGRAASAVIGVAAYSVVIGPTADSLAREMREAPVAKASGTTLATDALLAALGGRENLADVRAMAGRLLVSVRTAEAVDQTALDQAAPRGAVETAVGHWQILTAAGEQEIAQALART